ncbi:tyrosine-protein phosphatase Lar-like isoform X4 [Cloeon dipterum]|uniref:tyrosine-protein phosphatase Lar-like isoform X4 n=1 Tax=Cloeon dipterum TaxID=197152 RepID=UPI0032205DF6
MSSADRRRDHHRVCWCFVLISLLFALTTSVGHVDGTDLNVFPFVQYVSHPVHITVRPRNQQVKAGGVASLLCRAEGDPAPQVIWRKNTKRLVGPLPARYQVIEFPPPGGGALLRIEPVRAGRDEATYECVAMNDVGDAVTAEAVLSVYEFEKAPDGFPRIVQAPTTKVVEVGHTAVLQCEVGGDPEPRVYWIKDFVPIDMADQRFTILPQGSLQVSNSQEADQGKYECVAENELGTEYSHAIMLYVKVRRVPPQFTIPPPTVLEVLLGGNLNITCVAVGSPMPSVQWRKTNNPDVFITGPASHSTTSTTPAQDLTFQGNDDRSPLPIGRSVLELEDVRETDNFTCVAKSPLATIEATTTVKVLSLPVAPISLMVSEVGATSARLSWSYPKEDEPNYFVLQYRPTTMTNQAFSEISGIITKFYTVRGLTPFTQYEFHVSAINNIGRGPASIAVTANTGETVDSLQGNAKGGSVPKNVQVRPLSSSTMVIQWEEPESPNAQITGYKVYYTESPNLPLSQWRSQVVDNNQLTTISELTPHSIYTIRVQTLTNVGPGHLSPAVLVKTQQGVPSQPDSLDASEIGENSVKLQWSKPIIAGEHLTGYDLYWNDTYTKERHHRRLPVSDSYELTGLVPDTVYHVSLAARSQRGEGATTSPLVVKTQPYAVVTAAAVNLTVVNAEARKLHLRWGAAASPAGVVYRVLARESDSDTTEVVTHTSGKEAIIQGLQPGTTYVVTVTATLNGRIGKASDPIRATTFDDAYQTGKLYMPGPPQGVKVLPVNISCLQVWWRPPLDTEKRDLIRAYKITVKEVPLEGQENLFLEPLTFEVPSSKLELTSGGGELNVTGLQPSTEYSVQVSALTRRGEGEKSKPVMGTTPGGVPNKPTLEIRLLDEGEGLGVGVELEWSKPSNPHGELLGYRLRYGARQDDQHEGGQPMLYTDEDIVGAHTLQHRVQGLEHGTMYEFRLAGVTAAGVGQEAVERLPTPEGAPAGPPTNLSVDFQTPDVVALTWSPPMANLRRGRVLRYTAQLYKVEDHSAPVGERNVTLPKAVFVGLEENTEYSFQIRAFTVRGAGPPSEKLLVKTDRDAVRAPLSVNALATSDASVEVWWEPVPSRNKVIGYQVFYTMTAVEDLDEWQHKSVPVTESAELTNLEKFAQYAVAVAARTRTGLGKLSEKVTVKVKPEDVPLNLRAHDVSTHSMTLSWSPPIRLNPQNYRVSYDASKEFVDSQGITQVQLVPRRSIVLESSARSHTINELSPFTTYNVNLSAIPADGAYRPPIRITVTTQMAAPQPMVKPDFYGVVSGEEIQVILPQASEEYGPISHYFLIVVPDDPENAYKHPDQFLTDEVIGNSMKPSEFRPYAPYVAAKFPQRNIPYTFHLGNSAAYDGFVNKPLERGKKYRIFVRAVVDTPQKHLYTSSPFSEPLALDMREVPPGEPPRRPNPNVPAETSADVSVNRSLEEAGLLWIIGPVVAAAFLSLCLLSLLLMRSRRRQPSKQHDQSAASRPLMASNSEHNSAPVAPCSMNGAREAQSNGQQPCPPTPNDPVQLRRLHFKTAAMAAHPPVPMAQLAQHIESLRSEDNVRFSQEYESIEPGQQFTWDHSSLEVNKPKNRYANVIAYDHSRVVLQLENGEQGSDYINANFCDGYRKHNAYISTQGPLHETFGDFWRMVWEQKSASIVMMTRLEERARIKCDQYWPTRSTETYGPVTVNTIEVQELATYSIRTFHATRAGSSEKREVRQFQFTAWPDHGVPEHPAPFLVFLRRIKSLNPQGAGPIIVHCSAGVGRTGCFIVIDSMLERMKTEATIDIYGHVTCLRAQRNYMVQTEEQYIFIHEALLEAAVCGSTEVTARNLHTHLATISQLIPGDNLTKLQLEFKALSQSSFCGNSERFSSASLPINANKNRLMHVLPYENTRVCLSPIRGSDGSDYINASLVDGYRYRAAYVATQGPLPNTAADFWRMLWEYNSTIVVMLTKLKEMGREKCHQYWPSDRSVRYLNYVVDPLAEYNMPQYILREFKVTDSRDGQSRTVRQFQFIEWPEQGVPKSGEGFIEFIGQVHKTKEQFGQEGPITVHCSGGVGRTGVFITLSIVLERMQYEGMVDLLQTVRILRTQRPAMVQTEEQYEFCYRSALEYLGSFEYAA